MVLTNEEIQRLYMKALGNGGQEEFRAATGYATPAAAMEAQGTAPWQTYAGAPSNGGVPGPGDSPAIVVGEPSHVAVDGVPVGGIAMAGMPAMLAGLGLTALGALIGGVSGAALTGAGGAVAGYGGTMNGTVVQNLPFDIPLVGPGVPEPPNYMVKNRWATRVYSNKYGYIKINFYHLTNGWVAVYNNTTRAWTSYKPKRHIVISSDPRMSQIRKLEGVYNRTIRKLAKKSKALKLA